MFNIRIGGTRIVLLTQRYAYKIARVRPLKLFIRLIKIQSFKSSKDRFEEIYGKRLFEAGCQYLFVGYFANKREASYKILDDRVVSATPSFLHWWIVVQKRVDPIGNEPCPEWAPIEGARFPRDYGILSGKVVLVDLGDPRTTLALKNSL